MISSNIIFLVRHGISKSFSKGEDPVLIESGILFSKKLPTLCKEKIDFIATVNKQRCIDTIKYLKAEVKVQEFSKMEFKNLAPLNEAVLYQCSVICYGYEEIDRIFEKFGIVPDYRDQTYELIYRITIATDYVPKIDTIATGFSKRR